MNKNSIVSFFLNPQDKKQILYEALRKSSIEGVPDKEICEQYNLNYNYFRSIKRDFFKSIELGENVAGMFFADSKVGKRSKPIPEIEEKIISLRKNNLSITDIRAVLSSENIIISLWKIDLVIKNQGLPVLQRRSQAAKQQIILPDSIQSIDTSPIDKMTEEKFDSLGGSIFLFMPILQALNIAKIVKDAEYPETKQISSIQSVLSFLALKLMSTKRLSHSNDYSIDRGLGLFAGLNVLPKSAWYSSYSYRVTGEMNKKLLLGLHKSVEKLKSSNGDFNLDFTAIPHWGEESELEKNWSGKRNKGIKSVLALLVQDQGSKILKYGSAGTEQETQAESIIEFVDFYKETGCKINCLMFDSKFTTYAQLNKLNNDNIKFITLRRRSQDLIESIENIPEAQWHVTKLGKEFKRKHKNLTSCEKEISLKGYEGNLRQIIITHNGREKPTFLITNDFTLSQKAIILKYAKRWLVEQSISEQIEFYHLNHLSSSIVVKVDFDLTISILADTVYKLFAEQIARFSNSKSETINRLFIKNYSNFEINTVNKTITITLNKKVHLSLLHETEWFDGKTQIPWLFDYNLLFKIGSSL